ncbi:nucleotidyltransferase domain-containing protein [Limibacter armeniacum]|uniref:nucleotidyltransferase domain-containing protein n=1 Tax=Limibacter armeniacum TaxID=466084 RepID=UPI002FE5411E
MEKKIQAQLDTIEKTYNIRILYACESGSRAWGMHSPDSDYDIRFIYVREPEWYWSISEGKKDTIETITPDNLDLVGWDIRKVLQLTAKSNVASMEHLNSPIIYRETPQIRELLKAATTDCFSPKAVIYHYLGLAKNFSELLLEEKVSAKKVLYIIRSLLAANWVATYQTIPPIEIEELRKLIVSEVQSKELDRLLAEKMKAGEQEKTVLPTAIAILIQELMAKASEAVNTAATKKANYIKLDDIFRLILKEYGNTIAVN